MELTVKDMDMRKIYMLNKISLKSLAEKYGLALDQFVTLEIGFDGMIYILFSKNIPERINGMFVDTEADTDYSLIELMVDWETGEMLYHELILLGHHKMNFHFALPMVNDEILLLGARCMFYASGPENNAVVVDKQGKVVREFCLGDGIQDCITTEEGSIITSYFDEGVFGNFGWDKPIGMCGLIKWDSYGDPVWKADRDIMDCYAVNVDELDNLWYYYYTDFDLVKTDCQRETVYHPEIDGASSFLLTQDGMNVIFDKGYGRSGEYTSFTINYHTLKKSDDIEFCYNDNKIPVYIDRFRSSKAVLIDDEYNLFCKNIISV